jgi:uncharacterized SAM-binding protein YcdF (DUF218 family)
MGLISQLDRLTHPIIQAAILVVACLILLRWGRYRLAMGSLVLATAWLWLCATPAFATWLQQGIERPYAQQEAAAYPVADVIVVLGGGKLPRSGIDWNMDDTPTTRLGFGLQLYHASRASGMLLSGGDQALGMARKLREQGVPAAALQTEDASANTHQNALFSANILKREKLQRILLVTSGIHMPRALASFERQGLTVIPAPAFDPHDEPWQLGNPWLPRRAALTLSARCLREYIGLMGYRLRGWA